MTATTDIFDIYVEHNEFICDVYPIYEASKFSANLTPDCFCSNEGKDHFFEFCPKYDDTKNAILTAIQKWVESNHMSGMAFEAIGPHYGKEFYPGGKVSDRNVRSFFDGIDLIESFIDEFTFEETSQIDVEIVFDKPEFYVTTYDHDAPTGVTYIVRSSNLWESGFECHVGDTDIELSIANYPMSELKAYLPDTPKARFDLAHNAITTWHDLTDHTKIEPDVGYSVDETRAPFAILSEFSSFDGVASCFFLQDTYAYAITDGKRKVVYKEDDSTLYYKMPNNAGEAIYVSLQPKWYYQTGDLPGYVSPANHKLTDEELDSQLVDTIVWLDDIEEVDCADLPITKPTFKSVRDFIAELGDSCALACPDQFNDYLKSL